jgi:hypothetical protein
MRGTTRLLYSSLVPARGDTRRMRRPTKPDILITIRLQLRLLRATLDHTHRQSAATLPTANSKPTATELSASHCKDSAASSSSPIPFPIDSFNPFREAPTVIDFFTSLFSASRRGFPPLEALGLPAPLTLYTHWLLMRAIDQCERQCEELGEGKGKGEQKQNAGHVAGEGEGEAEGEGGRGVIKSVARSAPISATTFARGCCDVWRHSALLKIIALAQRETHSGMPHMLMVFPFLARRSSACSWSIQPVSKRDLLASGRS